MPYIYKRIITTPESKQIEYYSSIRKVGKYYGGRGINKNASKARQKIANEMRTTRKWQNIIECNFTDKDWFCRFSAPFGVFDSEEKFLKEFKNFRARVKRRCKKLGIELKYFGFRECGKLGKNWHMHIILSDEVRAIAQECWKYKDGGMNFTPLYQDCNYKKLAEYIHKDVSGNKRMMSSRNLTRPDVDVRPATKKELRKLAKGAVVDAPKGYYYIKDEFEYYVNDVTGARWYFKFRKLKTA